MEPRIARNDLEAFEPQRTVKTIHYDVELRLDLPSQRLQARTWVTLKTLGAVTSVTFLLNSDHNLDRATLEGVPVDVEPVQGDMFRLRLPYVAGPGENLRLALSYEGREEMGVSSSEGIELNLMNVWYPSFGLLDRFTASLKVGLAGAEDFTLIGPGKAVAEGYFLREVPFLDLFLIANRWKADRRTSGPVSVRIFALDHGSDALMELAVETLGLLENEFGPCPFDQVLIVEVPRREWGCYCREGLLIIPRGFKENTKEDVKEQLAHELTHLFTMIVTSPKQLRDDWLSEGLAEYRAYLLQGACTHELEPG